MVNNEFNSEQITSEIVRFIKSKLHEADKSKLILGLSGGIDSTVMYMLAIRAIGVDKIFTYALPYNNCDDKKSVKAAIAINKYVAGNLRAVIDIKPVVDSFYTVQPSEYRLGNIMARVRMIYLYDQAMAYNGLVLNTCNLSEDMVGYATKYGDGAGDLAPIAHLTKREIYKLAEYLQIPEELINRVPSAELWEGQTDEDELEFTYDELDTVIHMYKDSILPYSKYYTIYKMYIWMDNFKGMRPVNDRVWNIIRNKNIANQHKLATIPTIGVSYGS